MTDLSKEKRAELEQAKDAIRSLIAFAYEQGYHEMGYEPERVVFAALDEAEAKAPRWIPISESLPDSDVRVLATTHAGDDHIVVELEFTDDSEGNGEPYWSAAGGDLALCNYPFWMTLPPPPEAK